MTIKDAPSDPRDGVQSVGRALDVLEVVTAAGTLGVTEIGRRTGLKPSTAHGIVRTLTLRGYLARDEQRYRIGPAALVLAGQWTRSEDLGPHLRPLLDALSESTGSASTATILVGREAKIVASEPAPGPFGARVEEAVWKDPLQLATGQVLAASADPVIQAEMIARTRIVPTLHSSWKKVLDYTGAHGIGYKLTRDPRGSVGVAMPVVGKGGSVICAIGLHSPAYLAADILSGQCLELLWSTCAEASRLFGGELARPELPKLSLFRQHLPEQMLRPQTSSKETTS